MAKNKFSRYIWSGVKNLDLKIFIRRCIVKSGRADSSVASEGRAALIVDPATLVVGHITSAANYDIVKIRHRRFAIGTNLPDIPTHLLLTLLSLLICLLTLLLTLLSLLVCLLTLLLILLFGRLFCCLLTVLRILPLVLFRLGIR